MRRIPRPTALALGLLVAGCGGPGPAPGTPVSVPTEAGTGIATTASAGEPAATSTPPTSTPPTSAAGPTASASRPTAAPTTAKTSRKPPKVAPTTAKPPAKGSPVRTAPIDIVGSSYAETGPLTRAQLADECGGTLCVTIRETVEGPPDPNQDCTVKRIVQSVPIYRGDTITVVLTDPCGGFTEPSPTG
ncbi:hypothetical protein [Amycolatopsis sp. cmx-4-61]|uniref:hypothetical protein n=1 Tax=Amycolatopsis sp. cmx-4-61 TaxID=2790937 RepID=UPI00397C8493